MNKETIGILLTNTGTPEALTTKAIRRYLREFLSDKRVVQLPRLFWLPILYGFILPFRARRSLKLYQKIWTASGSPMRVSMQEITRKLREILPREQFAIEVGMHYGTPSISHALHQLQKKNIHHLIVLPLFPQYSNTTTAASFDRIASHIQSWNTLPTLHFMRDYAQHKNYIEALAMNVRTHWQTGQKADLLLISFHGIPKRFVTKGDVYQMQCEQTAHTLAKALHLSANEWQLCYQSQFGYDKWLQPSTQTLLRTLPKNNIKTVDVICPGFAVDCLETSEEIVITGKKIFLQAGGKDLHYISALNASDAQIELLHTLVNDMKP